MLYFDLSGWFDPFIFKRWFVELFLPSVIDKDGPIFLFGQSWVTIQRCSQQMQLIGSKYSTCRYLVQWNIHGKKFWKKWRLETWRTGDISREIFPLHLRRLEIDVNQTVSSNLISVVCIPLIAMNFWKSFQKKQHEICIPQNL